MTGRSAQAPEAETWIGFAGLARAVLFEGGRIRIVAAVSGGRIHPRDLPIRLPLELDAPPDRLLLPDAVEIGRYGLGVVEAEAVRDQREVAVEHYTLHLRQPPEGLPTGAALDSGASVFHLTVRNEPADPACAGLTLGESEVALDPRGSFWTADITLRGPERAMLRIGDPYWDRPMWEGDEPEDLPISLSQLPPIFHGTPQRLSSSGTGSGIFRHTLSFAWYDGPLALTAAAPGCGSVTLTCGVDAHRRGCRALTP